MNLDHPAFLIPILAGTIFMFCGLIMIKFPPKKINSFYGYRTSNSMKLQERWDFAQIYSAGQLLKSGLILILTSILGLIFKIEEGIGIAIGLGLMVAIVIILLARTEKAISLRFGSK